MAEQDLEDSEWVFIEPSPEAVREMLFGSMAEYRRALRDIASPKLVNRVTGEEIKNG